VLLPLGKPVRREDGSIDHFHLAGEGYDSNSEHPLLGRALWKFLADHAGHPFRVAFSDEPDFEVVASFSEIGGDEIGDVTLVEYMQDWSG